MSEIRNLTRNGETFYPLTTSSAVINESTGEGLVIDDIPTYESENLVKSGGVFSADIDAAFLKDKVFSYSGLTTHTNIQFPYFATSRKYKFVNLDSNNLRVYARTGIGVTTNQYLIAIDANKEKIVELSSDYTILFYMNDYDTNNFTISYYDEVKEEVISNIDTLMQLNELYIDSASDYDGLLQGKYLISSGSVGTLGAFNILGYKVKKGQNVKINLTNSAGNATLWVLYSVDNIADISTSTKIEASPNSTSQNGEYTISVSQDGMLCFSKYVTATLNIYMQKGLEYVYNQIPSYGVRYKVLTDSILTAYAYNSQYDLVTEIGVTGGNSLIEFKRFGLIEKGSPLGFESAINSFSIGTDWHSPIIVAAVNNADGDNKTGDAFNVHYTGGNHQYNNQGSGSTPTARLVSYKFMADNRELSNGDTGKCNSITILWANRIQGYNTTKANGSGREIIEERHNLTYNGISFKTTGRLIPLEEVVIERFYGLGFSRVSDIFTTYRFIGGSNRGIFQSSSNENSGNKKPNGVCAYGVDYNIKMLVDDTYDLGRREMLPDNQSGVFKSSGKVYSFLILGNQTLQTNISLDYCGSWEFCNII